MKAKESQAASSAAAGLGALPINGNLILILIILQFFFSGYLFFKINSMNGTGIAQAAAPAAPSADGAAAAPEPVTDTTKMPDVTDKDHIRGSKDAQVLMVEYSDFECPFCKTFKTTVDQAITEYGDKVGFVYRHYPLSFHPKAQKTAEASECVAELGGNDAFWLFHDSVFEKMPDLELTGLAAIAGEAGVDQGAFQECLDSGKHAQKVKDDMAGGSAAGVQGTPGMILISKDGQRDFLGGAYPYEDVKAKIDALLE